jgi:hypothetical protein
MQHPNILHGMKVHPPAGTAAPTGLPLVPPSAGSIARLLTVGRLDQKCQNGKGPSAQRHPLAGEKQDRTIGLEFKRTKAQGVIGNWLSDAFD